MSDLIWIGNTLYPRWFVLSVPIVGLLLALFILFALLFVFGERRE